MHGKIVGTIPANNPNLLLLWPLLWLWEKITRKSSFAWHWLAYTGFPKQTIRQTIRVAGDSRLSLHSWWHGVSWGTNFTWQQVVVLRAARPVVYQVGFIGRGHCQLCSIRVIGDVGVLVGPEDTTFFGVTVDGQPIQLNIVGYTTRRQMPKKLPLL